MPSDAIITLRNVDKTYRIYSHPAQALLGRLSQGRLGNPKEYRALKDVSLEIHQGETIGIIGRNGAGKSTLLQIICGIAHPDRGQVSINGRISAMLELGAGFHPELTGEENIYLQGAIAGFTRQQMAGRISDICEFADIGEYLLLPVKTYSSGMFVRLAFAVSIHLDPQILVIDEALAVGDAAFQVKCFRRIRDFQETGGTILLVTHSTEQVAHFCNRAIFLDKGKIIAHGDTRETLAQYIRHLKGEAVSPPNIGISSKQLEKHPLYQPQEMRWGDQHAEIVDVLLRQNGEDNPQSFLAGKTIDILVQIRFHAAISHPIYGLTIKTKEGTQLFTTNTKELLGSSTPHQDEASEVVVMFSIDPYLDAGDYLISLGVASETLTGLIPHDRRYDVLRLPIAHPHAPRQGIAMNPTVEILEATRL